MRNTNKKGFTIVELVIVVAVIAILAAVLIPTFSSIIKKANIASDTAVAKNLNTAAISAGAKDFDSAIEAVKDAGYLLANLNAKADGCYFVWDNVNNQFLLVDTKNDYKVIYSNTDASEKSANNWLVAVSDPEAIAAIKAAGCGVKQIATDYEDLMANLAAGGEVYVDESVVLNNDNRLVFDDNKETIINLGSSSINTSGIVRPENPGDKDNNLAVPIYVKNGTVTFKGGNISVAGESQNLDNRTVKIVMRTEAGSTVNFEDTYIDSSTFNGQIKIGGTANLKNVIIKATKVGVDTTGSSVVVLDNVTINMIKGNADDSYGAWVWACNSDHKGTENSITIKSGTYTRENIGGTYGGIVSCGGVVNIEGGTFTAEDGKYFSFGTDGLNNKIVITGGTFDGYTFDELYAGTADIDWADLCVGDYTITTSEYEDKPAVVITK